VKPGDFFIGVLEFFAVLLPGLVATWLFDQYLPPHYHIAWEASEGSDHLVGGAAFLLSSYVLGHFVFMIGSNLDSSYDRWRRREKPAASDAAFKAAEQLAHKLAGDLIGGDFTILKWAKVYIQIHGSGARVDIDRLEAHEKFFRSFVVIAIALTAHFLLRERAFFMALGSAILGLLSYHRFIDQRWKATELTYGTAVILHATKQKSSDEKQGPGEPESED
jgi:hypothetical protein